MIGITWPEFLKYGKDIFDALEAAQVTVGRDQLALDDFEVAMWGAALSGLGWSVEPRLKPKRGAMRFDFSVKAQLEAMQARDQYEAGRRARSEADQSRRKTWWGGEMDPNEVGVVADAVPTYP